MEQQIIIPMTIYVFYMWALGLLSFKVRLRAVKDKKIKLNYFKAYQGESSEAVTVVGRHYDNQFQLPMLFFIGCLAHLVIKQVDSLTIALAWAFVISRLGHSYEHLGKNRITNRVIWFASGWFIVGALWAQLILQTEF